MRGGARSWALGAWSVLGVYLSETQQRILGALCRPLEEQGAFATPGTHDVVLRLSTNPGDILDDSVSTPRGLAIAGQAQACTSKAAAAATSSTADDATLPARSAARRPPANLRTSRHARSRAPAGAPAAGPWTTS